MDHQFRINQNRAQTRELLKRRLIQSHRQHTEVAEKRIFKRRILRSIRNVAIATLIACALVWIAVTYWGVKITMVTSPVVHSTPLETNALATVLPAQMPKPAASMPVSEEQSEGQPATELSGAQAELRFDSELAIKPINQSTKSSSPLTSPLEKP